MLALGCLTVAGRMSAELKTRNVVLVTLDGVRWQEVFRGPDDALINQETGGVTDVMLAGLRATYGSKPPAERRRLMMPFLWEEVAAHGQLYGNRDQGSPMRVTNAVRMSYPGYNELLTGVADPAIANNVRRPNSNVTVLEWLNGRPAWAGRVVPLAAWNTFASILNVERSHLPLWLTNQPPAPGTASPRMREIEGWMEDIPTKDPEEHYDAFVYQAAIDAIETRAPRVLFIGFGEPDTYGHRRNYDRYLDSLHRLDRFIRQLWTLLQSLPQYRDTTTLVLTTDHGRGAAPPEWANHGARAEGSDETWLAVLGPDTRALGERRDTAEITNAQVAATIAALLGEDFRAAFPAAAPPIAGVMAAPVR